MRNLWVCRCLLAAHMPAIWLLANPLASYAGPNLRRNGGPARPTNLVLTIQAREQHIRRERPPQTSAPIRRYALWRSPCAPRCSAQTVWWKPPANRLRKATSLRQALCETGWFLPVHDRPFFREFAVRLNPETWNETTGTDLNRYLATHGIIGGLDLANLEGGSGVPGGWLLAATEKRRRSDINRLIDLIGAYRRDRGWKS